MQNKSMHQRVNRLLHGREPFEDDEVAEVLNKNLHL